MPVHITDQNHVVSQAEYSLSGATHTLDYTKSSFNLTELGGIEGRHRTFISGTRESYNPVAIRPASLTGASNVTISGNTITKTGANGWDGSAYSVDEFDGLSDFAVEFEVNSVADQRNMFGLNSDWTTNTSYNTIDFAIYQVNNYVQIYENGANKGSFNTNTFAVGAKLGVRYLNGKIEYTVNGDIVYTSTNSPTFPMRIDTSIHRQNDALSNISIYDNQIPQSFNLDIIGNADEELSDEHKEALEFYELYPLNGSKYSYLEFLKNPNSVPAVNYPIEVQHVYQFVEDINKIDIP